MTKVRDVMTKNVVAFKPEDSIYEAARILRERKISGAPVVEGEKVVGMISEADIMGLIEEHDIDVNTILPSPLDVLELPVRMKLELNEVLEKIKKASSALVSDVMTEKVVSISPDAAISDAAKIMSGKKVNRLPVIEKEKLVGIVSRGDIIGAL
ncbi:MAG: CBS domain-containing protein [Candidatus Hydrothermarchaeota archaeon]|nr:CBS domain-containing protein [Candidatus Hydrothermarchaeota archaeon]